MIRLSLIIPVFNVEKTLRDSLDSIQCHRPEEVEVILVDDGSKDRTPELLKTWGDSTPFPFQIIRQENQGAAAARNTAIEATTGQYLLFLDADDWWEKGAIDRILDLTGCDADIVGWDWKNVTPASQRTLHQPKYDSPGHAIKCLMSGTMKWNLWLFAVKRSLIMDNGIRFLPGADMGEDMRFMFKAFATADSVAQIQEPLYRYNAANPASISLQFNERRRKEVSSNLTAVVQDLEASPYSDICQTLLPHLKLYVKLPLLISLSRENYEVWYHWFPESNPFAGKNPEIPFRTRLLQCMASHRLWWAVRLYNILVYRILSPIIH